MTLDTLTPLQEMRERFLAKAQGYDQRASALGYGHRVLETNDADAYKRDAATLERAIAIIEKAQTSVLVPKEIAEAASGTVALLGDERICRFGRPSPEARTALRNLAVALGWKEAGTDG